MASQFGKDVAAGGDAVGQYLDQLYIWVTRGSGGAVVISLLVVVGFCVALGTIGGLLEEYKRKREYERRQKKSN
jgi:hypothetical protein